VPDIVVLVPTDQAAKEKSMKYPRILVSLAALVLLPLVSISQEKKPPSIKLLMAKTEFQAAGLTKLTPEELQVLDKWLQRYTDQVLAQATQRQGLVDDTQQKSYQIEVSHDDQYFVINGQNYRARTFCYNMLVGDRVIFLEGNEYGNCTTAVITNLRTGQTCEVWCE
jgi:hypothetical protein